MRITITVLVAAPLLACGAGMTDSDQSTNRGCMTAATAAPALGGSISMRYQESATVQGETGAWRSIREEAPRRGPSEIGR